MTCRDWLSHNGYEEVAALIDQAMTKIRAKGTKQRRNWWDILAGDVHGRPRVREGIEFPVLRVAQIRQGRRVTQNAISIDASEQPPDVVATNRWPKKHSALPTKTKRQLKKRDTRRSRAS
jgi:hypothetical protein